MPLFTTFTDDGTGLLRTGKGLVTGADFLAADAELLASQAAMRRLRYVLMDFSETTEFRAIPEEVRSLARLDGRVSEYATNISVAIVAPRDQEFGMSRMWEVFVEGTGWQTAVFRDRAEAVAWLRQRFPVLDL